MDSKTEDFIIKATEKHHGKYNYDKTEYINSREKITITCIEHGDFLQSPAKHLIGRGCPECAKKTRADKKRLKFDDVVGRLKKIHEDRYKYIYNELKYGNRTRIDIICPVHGVFSQVLYSHISGCGCPKCAGNIQKTNDEFITDSIRVHGNIYDYSKSVYNGVFNKVTIICHEHGEFNQTPDNHINSKQGCPFCGSAGTYNKRFFEDNPELRNITSILYLMEFINQDEKFLKVGITKKNTKKRWAGEKSGIYDTSIIVEKTLPLYEAWSIEQEILSEYKDRRHFTMEKFSGHTEAILYDYKNGVITRINEALVMRGVL